MLHRFCVFSHDELVCKMALEPDNLNYGIATACFIDMAEMVDSEKKLRKSLLEWGVTDAERVSFELIPDDERQCKICKTTCFLSAVQCPCNTELVCLRHYTKLCKCPPATHMLKYRYTLDELPLMLQKIKVKAEKLEVWLRKIRDPVNPNTPPRMPYHEFKQLAEEAIANKFPDTLVLDRVKEGLMEAKKCITVIQQLEIMNHTPERAQDDTKYKLSLIELDMFVHEIDNLCCVIPEGDCIRELQKLGTDFVVRAKEMVNTPIDTAIEMKVIELIDEGSLLCIELSELYALKDYLTQVNWYGRARAARETKGYRPITELKEIMNDGLTLTPHFILECQLADLHVIVLTAEEWEESAKNVFVEGTESQIPEMERLIERAELMEAILPTLQTLRETYNSIKEWQATVEQMESRDTYPSFNTLEYVVDSGKAINFPLDQLKRMEDHLNLARDWKRRTITAFLRSSSSFSLMDILSPRTQPVMIPKRYSVLSGKSYNEIISITSLFEFNENMKTAQMLAIFKQYEIKEIEEMRELRQLNMTKNPEIDKYCVCRKHFYGYMHHCQLCKDWYHINCVPKPKLTVRPRPLSSIAPSTTKLRSIIVPPLTTRKLDRDIKYLCPSCMRSRRPRLETILHLLVALQRLPIRIPEGEALQCLTERAMNWQDRAKKMFATDEIVEFLKRLTEISRNEINLNVDVPLPSASTSKIRTYPAYSLESIFLSSSSDDDCTNPEDSDSEQQKL